MSLDIAASALNALATRQQVTANNIANVNTPGFTPGRVDMQELSGRGVEATVRQDVGSTPSSSGETSPSATDLSRELVHMMATQRAYDANATMLSSQAHLQGKMINEMV